MKMKIEQDNIEGSKRRQIALSFIEAERNAIDDLDRLVRGSLFPEEDALECSPISNCFVSSVAGLSHIDLKASLEKVRDTVVFRFLAGNIEGRVERYEEHDAYIEEAHPNSQSMAFVHLTADYYSRLAGYLADEGLPCSPDAAVRVCEDKKLLGEIVREGLLSDVAEQVSLEYRAACEYHLMQNWSDVTVYREPVDGAKVVDLFPSAAFLTTVLRGAENMLDDFVSSVMATLEWKDVDIAFQQRRAWLSACKSGHAQPYKYSRNYLTAVPSRHSSGPQFQ